MADKWPFINCRICNPRQNKNANHLKIKQLAFLICRPIRIRTLTSGTKIRCATVTPWVFPQSGSCTTFESERKNITYRNTQKVSRKKICIKKKLYPKMALKSHICLDMGMRLVIQQRKIFVPEREKIANLRVQTQHRQRERLPGELQPRLLHMIII